MNEGLIHADIFFFVTTIVMVVVGIVLTVALVYLVRILHNVDRLTRKVEHETSEILADIRMIRNEIKSEGFRLKHIIGFVLRFITKTTKKAKIIKKNIQEHYE